MTNWQVSGCHISERQSEIALTAAPRREITVVTLLETTTGTAGTREFGRTTEYDAGHVHDVVTTGSMAHDW